MKVGYWLIGTFVLIGLWKVGSVSGVEAARPYLPPHSSKNHQVPTSHAAPSIPPSEPVVVPLPLPSSENIEPHQGPSKSFQDVLKSLEKNQVPLPPQRLIDPPPLPWALREARKYIIVVDPGHGGRDPGAKSRKGVYEKHITLNAAKHLKKKLEATKRYRVILTRDRDDYMKLRDRIAIARKHKADLFISLHADKIKSPKIRGLSVYTLSDKASDKEAEDLARHANKSGIIDGLDLSSESQEVTNILIGLAQRETMNLSAQFAKRVMHELGKVTTLLRKTHRFAGFAVLKAPDVPSILIEMGYLSNRQDEAFLLSPKKRDKLLDALVKAIDTYFLYDHPKVREYQ